MSRPHVLGVDDAPFVKHRDREVPIVGVMMEGSDRVESIAITRFGVDGEDATGFLADWIASLRSFESLQAVVLGGITIGGLGIVDIADLAGRLEMPVLSVTRRDTATNQVAAALEAADLANRVPVLERAPPARRLGEGLFVACAGADDEKAEHLVAATIAKAQLPEPLRIAHLIGAAIVQGESKGRA